METLWAVWEAEYPDEGSTRYSALTAKGAARRYRKDIRERCPLPELTPLEVEEICSWRSE